ncbi:CLIP-associating protein 1 like protein [Argiope bruennichi]|uniref:CLIP-associating protein 1 like protein n=1 Tax=Argiope bruennichi TaxID=94029 RepID=A0A8T0ESR3_ARGBR|nr:CLIP-associating protein 1 like protein [Argiope bruennichi]
MPTTKLNQEQQSSQVVTNGSALLNSANGLSHSSTDIENHPPTVNTNSSTSNGTHEGHATSIGDDSSSYTTESDLTSLLAKVHSVQICDSDLAGTSSKFLDGAGFTNGDIPADSKIPSLHNGLASDRDPYSAVDSMSSSGNNSNPRTRSPDFRVRFSEDGHIPPATQVSDIHVVSSCEPVPCSNGATGCESPTDGAKGGNPTLWLGDDQMLLLPGKSHSEETDSNSGTSETKSFEGLLSPNGTSILWDEDTDWILLFDNMIRYADRKQQRTTRSCGCKGSRTEDETDSKSQSSTTKSAAAKRASSAPPARRTMFTSSKSLPSSTTPKRKPSLKSTTKPMSSGGGAGGADEEMFIKSFEDVPRITLYSARDLESELTKIKETLGNPSNDWEKRVEMCKRFRSVIVAGGHEYDEFYLHLRLLEHPFQISVKDLRSQVVREACITIAYLSQQLGSKLDRFSEALLPCLINLIPNSAKIMSTAGIVAIRFIIRYTHVSRLIPIITTNLSSKSKDIRKTCFEFLDQLLVTWPTHPMEKHVAILTDAIRKGISDADPEARAFSRKAYWSFADHFREQADALLNSLDNSKQRMLHDELTMSNSSSSSSLTQSNKPYRSTASNHGGSVENLNYGRTGTLGRRTGISNLPISKQDPSSGIPTRLRSTSAIDLSAVRRAKARASYSTIANLARGSGASLPRTPATRRNEISVHAITSPERVVKSRPRGSSQSQPNSRPDSPSSRLSYATYSSPDGKSNRTRTKSGIPIATSRDASPTRPSFGTHERRLSGSRTRLTGAGEKYPTLSSSAAPLMAERTLQQSREAEVAVADALRAPTRRRYNAFDDQSDESETSSVCSDRSFSSFGRSVDDINEVIHNLHSIHWSDRKEGLQSLQAYFRSGRFLSHIELKKVTDIFSKIFMDPHTKVFSLFLDTLNELIVIHKNDLHSWLYVLLTRLFLKMGCDILGSVLAKIQKTLELVKESFPYENQFSAIMKFLNDQTQTPNTKIRFTIDLIRTPRSVGNRNSPCPVMSHLQSPNSGLPWPRSHGGTPQNRSFEYDDTENLNPEEITNSWKKTMSEIEEYKSDDFYDKMSDKIIRDSPSRTISSRHNSLDGHFDNRLELNSSTDSSPTKRSPSDYSSLSFPRNEASLLFDRELSEIPSEIDNEIDGLLTTDNHKTIFSIVNELSKSTKNENKIQALGRLICLAREQSSIITKEDFCVIFKEVIATVSETKFPVKTLALKALCELMKTKADYFQEYTELTILRILESYKDTENDVIKMADLCSAVAAIHLRPDQSIRVLTAIIHDGDMPINQAAIKMLTKAVEHHPKQIIENMLPEMMPKLIEAYDNIESAVRKAAVFCMVAIHCKVGEKMQPHLAGLNSCKMKLLNVYIKKAQLQNAGGGSSPGSPGNPPSSSSSQ